MPSPMMHSLTAATLLLSLPSTLAAGLYSKGSPVLQVSGTDYQSLIANSNHTSMLEFYAPWCGHCKNLQPAYEKAAKSLAGLAKVAAVNCDDELNKPFCGGMDVKGFPTLKIVRPGKKAGKPAVEEYQGPRTAKGIVDAVIDKIPNHVTRLKDGEYETWVGESGVKAILFSDKGTVSALLKALAIDFLGSVKVAQIRDKETQTAAKMGVTKFPTFMILTSADAEPMIYSGELKKEPMVAFLSKVATPNPDPAPKKSKSKKASSTKKDSAKSSKASSSFSKASASHESAESASSAATQTTETLEDMNPPTESPEPIVEKQKPVALPDIAPPITSLPEGLSLQQKCLNTKSGTCILALMSEDMSQFDQGTGNDPTTEVVGALSEIHAKHEAAKRNLFPFYQLPSTNSQATALRTRLSLGRDIQLVAVNGKRGWYRHYISTDFSHNALETWIDEIRMGDGAKSRLPEGLIVPVEELPAAPVETKEPVAPKAENGGSMADQLKEQMPKGMDFEFEELDDEAYEKLMADASARAAQPTAEAETGREEPLVEEVKADGHDEL
ncbi:hypothetical protein LTR95_014362 [Oleoguttula sp. CCFEE 5521]